MELNTTLNATLVGTALDRTDIFGYQWIIALIVAFLIIILITRKPSSMAKVFLPVVVMLRLGGLKFGTFMYPTFVSLGTIFFVSSILSIDTITSVIGASVGAFKRAGESLGKLATEDEKMLYGRRLTQAERLAMRTAKRKQREDEIAGASDLADKRRLERFVGIKRTLDARQELTDYEKEKRMKKMERQIKEREMNLKDVDLQTKKLETAHRRMVFPDKSIADLAISDIKGKWARKYFEERDKVTPNPEKLDFIIKKLTGKKKKKEEEINN